MNDPQSAQDCKKDELSLTPFSSNLNEDFNLQRKYVPQGFIKGAASGLEKGFSDISSSLTRLSKNRGPTRVSSKLRNTCILGSGLVTALLCSSNEASE